MFFLFTAHKAQAQIKISGVITNNKKEVLAGATVNEKGIPNSTSTNETGSFHITISGPQSVLVISSVGHETKELTVEQKVVLNVALSSSNKELDQVVGVGYSD